MISASIVNGQVVADSTATKTSETKTGSSELGKDAFLQLLVTQMQYQDPLEPASNTEYISQLAQFSSLEEMQNLNKSLTNNSAYDLVGQYVVMAVGSSTDSENITYIAGKVDYVELDDNGKACLGINGSTYSIDDLDSVVSDDYYESVKNAASTTTTTT